MSADFSGLAVALATPFTADGALDENGFRALVCHVLAGGVDVLVPLGSTGEAATLDDSERERVVEICLEEADGKPVVVGTGSNNTRQAASWARRVQQQGASGALVVTPYYNKPTVDGLVAHFAACADAAPDLPMIVYNVPGRTGLNLAPAGLARLWENPAVVAVKEASGNLAQIAEIARTLPPGKQLLSGDDSLTLPVIAVGGAGVISVVGNLVPRETKALVDAARRSDLAAAQHWQKAMLPLVDALFVESNPIPLKAGLRLLELAGDRLRLPLTTALPATVDRLRRSLDQLRAAGEPQ